MGTDWSDPKYKAASQKNHDMMMGAMGASAPTYGNYNSFRHGQVLAGQDAQIHSAQSVRSHQSVGPTQGPLISEGQKRRLLKSLKRGFIFTCKAAAILSVCGAVGYIVWIIDDSRYGCDGIGHEADYCHHLPWLDYPKP